MTDEVLEDLPYDELRERAFALAESRRDLGFFVDLLNHTRALGAVSAEGGSLGDIGATLSELLVGAREAFGGGELGEYEPLFRARFATYLREHAAG